MARLSSRSPDQVFPEPRGPSPDAQGTVVIKASSLASQVYEELRRRITEGRLEEEQPLVIASLVREFAVSQTPVREALARLHAEGLAIFTNNVGYRVAPRPSSADYDAWMQARLVIEVGAMRTGLSTIRPEDLEKLAAINHEIETADFGTQFAGVRRFAELNRNFHRHLIVMTGNQFLVRAYDQIWLGAQFSRVHYETGILDQERIAKEHAAILGSLRSADQAAAAEALTRHITMSLERDAKRQASLV